MWNFARTIQKKVILASYRTGDEKWIFFENPKRKKSWVDLGAPSTSTARPNRFNRKTMLCVWWDQKDAIMSYWSLAKQLIAKRYQQQLIDLNRSLLKKRPEYQKRQHKVIFLHDKAPSHTAKPVWDTKAFSWEVLPHAAYLPDLAPSDYHLFASMGHALCWTELWFIWRWKNESMNGSRQKGKIFTSVIQIARKMGKMCN